MSTDTSEVLIDSGSITGGNGANVIGNASGSMGGGYGGDAYDRFSFAPGPVPDVTINGGTFRGGNGGNANGKSQDNFGGGGGHGFFLFNNHLTKINQGAFIGGNGGDANGTATYLKQAGAGGDALIVGDGDVQIYGGIFTAGLTGAGSLPSRSSTGLAVNDDGLITVFGSHFTVNGVSNFYGTLPESTGSFTGLLHDNSAITTIDYRLLSSGYPGIHSRITLAPVPEFSSVASFGALLLLGAGGLVFTKRKRAC